jgi:hypothetical protein
LFLFLDAVLLEVHELLEGEENGAFFLLFGHGDVNLQSVTARTHSSLSTRLDGEYQPSRDRVKLDGPRGFSTVTPASIRVDAPRGGSVDEPRPVPPQRGPRGVGVLHTLPYLVR